MNPAKQSQLPGLFNGEPVTVEGADLAAKIREIEAQGFYIRRMDADGSRYTLHLSRDPKPDCACDICAELTAPSDQIEAALRHTAELEAIASE